jgi:malate dehydrogenase (oxaloacetate-decarboxylating)(NADP+)
MEGKAVLFKKFAGIDAFDIEVDEKDPERLAAVVKALEPTFGAVNLEDIKAPDCFTVEAECRKSMKIPVFHDDQHGTAIVAAAVINALDLTGKRFEDIKLVSTGGGAAGIACLNLLLSLGLRRENVWLLDIDGLVYKGRPSDPQKADFAQDSPHRVLGDVIEDADVFLGLSGPGVLKTDHVQRMAEKPIILALANPNPEIDPGEARAVRPDAIIATGRSDYPNQVNNVLCFPFIFRGALDSGATTINEEMKIAAANAIASLARKSSVAEVANTYRDERLVFGPEYVIPKPFDPRLLVHVASAVARAAMESGVAERPIEDFAAYESRLARFVYRSGMLMKPLFEKTKENRRRIVYAEGEDERTLRAVRTILDEGYAEPILIGRPTVIGLRCERAGINLSPGKDFEIVNPEEDDRYGEYWRTYHALNARRGCSMDAARSIMRTNTTAIAAMMVQRGEADAMICGLTGDHDWHLRYIDNVLTMETIGCVYAALGVVILKSGAVFMADPYVNYDPSAEELADITEMAAAEVRHFDITPRVGLVSHSNFGSANTPSAQKMREVRRILKERNVDFEVEGEMRASTALDAGLRERFMPDAELTDPANLLIFPSLDAANAAMNVLKSLGDGQPVGPLLLGAGGRAQIVTPSATSRGLLNITAIAGTWDQVARPEADIPHLG